MVVTYNAGAQSRAYRRTSISPAPFPFPGQVLADTRNEYRGWFGVPVTVLMDEVSSGFWWAMSREEQREVEKRKRAALY